MERAPGNLQHNDSGNGTFEKLIMDNFDNYIPGDDFMSDYLGSLTSSVGVDVQQQQPQQQQQPSRLQHQTSLQVHQQMLLDQQQQQQQAQQLNAQQQQQAVQQQQLNEMTRASGGLQSDPFGSGSMFLNSTSRQGSAASSGLLAYSGGSGDQAMMGMMGGRPPLPQTPGSIPPDLRTASGGYPDQQQAMAMLLQQQQQQQMQSQQSYPPAGAPIDYSVPQTSYPQIPPQPDWNAQGQLPPNYAAGQPNVNVMMTSQASVSQPPNVVIASAPPQADFAGAPGGAARVAPHRLVVAPTPPQASAELQRVAGSMAPPPARRPSYEAAGLTGALNGGVSGTYERLAGAGPSSAPSGGSDELGYQDGEGDDDMEVGDDGQPVSRNRRHRTLRQQMLNKQAQQRYRERKKAKASDLEKTVAALADQLGNMEGVKAENATLQDKNLALVSQLRAREEELERLLREQAAQPAYMKTNSGRVLEVPKPDEGPTTAQQLAELSATYQSTVREVREFLEKYSLQNADDVDINAAHVPEAQIARLATMVETVNDIHSRALRMDGSNAAGLVSASVDRSSGRHDANRRWAEAARKLHFTKEQLDKMLNVRTEHLKRLHRIYEERRQVNLEAISVLLPQERGGSAPAMSMERAKSWLPSMFHRSKHASKQKDVMKKLQDNLSAEQRLASELDYMVFRRILTPVQGSHFILMKYPAYCDSLSLCNGVAEMQGVFDKDEPDTI
mmetsp:Transcript_19578/g.59225  ORF Transcript_19578/g.59225 Transcript_19578/m.59225 type:complete len:727 (+) Transcript_19578:227-2407(+)